MEQKRKIRYIIVFLLLGGCVVLLCVLLDQNGALYDVSSSFHFPKSCRAVSASGARTRTYSSSRSSTSDISASGCPATPNTG